MVASSATELAWLHRSVLISQIQFCDSKRIKWYMAYIMYSCSCKCDTSILYCTHDTMSRSTKIMRIQTLHDLNNVVERPSAHLMYGQHVYFTTSICHRGVWHLFFLSHTCCFFVHLYNCLTGDTIAARNCYKPYPFWHGQLPLAPPNCVVSTVASKVQSCEHQEHSISLKLLLLCSLMVVFKSKLMDTQHAFEFQSQTEITMIQQIILLNNTWHA